MTTPPPDALWTAEPFAVLDDDARARLLAATTTLTVEDGQAVYHADEATTGLYILLDGAVRLVDPLLSTLGTEAGERIDTVGTLISKGSVLQAFSHRHTLYADGPTRLLMLERDAFETLFDQGDPIAFRLLDVLVRDISADVRALNHAIQELLGES